MSKVISFRLGEDNPREAQALAVLKARYEQGYRTRTIIAEALIRLDESTNNSETKDNVENLAMIAYQVKNLMDLITSKNNFPSVSKKDGDKEAELTGNFLAVVKLAAKPGLRLDSG